MAVDVKWKLVQNSYPQSIKFLVVLELSLPILKFQFAICFRYSIAECHFATKLIFFETRFISSQFPLKHHMAIHTFMVYLHLNCVQIQYVDQHAQLIVNIMEDHHWSP